MKKINVLYICHAASNLGGASQSLLDMIVSVKDFVNPIIITNTTGLMYERFIENDIRCYNFPFLENLRPGIIKFIPRYMIYLLENRRMLKLVLGMIKTLNLKIDIVHSNSSVFTFGYDLARILDIPHVWHIRELQGEKFQLYPYLGLKNLKRKIWNTEASIGITSSTYDYWQLNHSRLSYSKWDAVRSIDDACYIRKKESYFLFCCTNLGEKLKGLLEAVKGFYLSGLYRQGYKLKIIGRKNEGNDYIREIDEFILRHQLTDSVIFMGVQKEVKPFFAKATAFLMCSSHEAMGRVTVESMFYGCPVIGYNANGTQELLQDGKYGFIFNSFEQLPSIMKKVACCDNSEMIIRAQQFARDNFSIESYGDFIQKVYTDVLRNVDINKSVSVQKCVMAKTK